MGLTGYNAASPDEASVRQQLILKDKRGLKFGEIKLEVGYQPHTTACAARTMLIPLKIEASPRHFAGVISRQTGSANVRPHGVDRACRGDAHLSYKRHTAITAASHAP
jgi:hypothetical protein